MTSPAALELEQIAVARVAPGATPQRGTMQGRDYVVQCLSFSAPVIAIISLVTALILYFVGNNPAAPSPTVAYGAGLLVVVAIFSVVVSINACRERALRSFDQSAQDIEKGVQESAVLDDAREKADKERLDADAARAKEVEAELVTMKTENAQLTTNAARTQAELDQLKTEHLKLTEDEKAASDELVVMKAQNAAVANELITLKTEDLALKTQSEAELATLKQDLQSMEAQNAAVANELTTLKTEDLALKTQSEAELATLKQDLQSMEAQNQENKKTIAELEQTLTSLSGVRDDLKTELESVKSINADFSTKIADFESKFASLSTSETEQLGKIIQLQAQEKALQAGLTSIKFDAQALTLQTQAQKEALEKECDHLRAEIDDLAKERVSLHQENEDMKASLQELHKQALANQEAMQTEKSLLQELKEKINSLEQHLEHVPGASDPSHT